jgi:serine/threonine protein kinase
MTLTAGTTIAGKYLVEKEIRKEKTALLYAARDTVGNRQVWLKAMHPDLVAQGKFVEQFRREAEILAQLDLPQVPKILDRGVEGQVHYIVTEQVAGSPLKDMLQRLGTLEVEQALNYVRQTAECLHLANLKGVVHRDICPANIIVTPTGGVKIINFGLLQSAEAEEINPLEMMDTPDYIAPEQAEGDEVDIRSDIYSLGATLYELLAGEPPYRGVNPMEVVMKHLSAPLPSLRHVRPDAPPEVDEIIRRCMAKKPGDRYQDPAELIADIRRLLGQSPIELPTELAPEVAAPTAPPAEVAAPPPPPEAPPSPPPPAEVAPAPIPLPIEVEPTPGEKRKLPLVPIAIGGAVVLLLIIAALLLFRGGGGPGEATESPRTAAAISGQATPSEAAATDTPVPTTAATPSPTVAPTDTSTPAATPTGTSTPAATPTGTSTPAATPTNTPTPTAIPTNTPIPSPRSTPTPKPTEELCFIAESENYIGIPGNMMQLEGVIKDSQGEPLPGVPIRMSRPEWNYESAVWGSGAGGYYLVDGLVQAGVWKIDLPNKKSKPFSVELIPGKKAVVNWQEKPCE